MRFAGAQRERGITHVPWLHVREGEGGLRERALDLLAWHYRASHPATIDRVLCAIDDWGGQERVVGVLVVSRPVLNGPWRARAWRELFGRELLPRENAQRVNAMLRTISRVVVEPRWRGLGVASAMLGAYLRDPATPLTETIASMGRWHPLFERAGMRRVVLARSRRDRVLGVALRERGLEAWRLVEEHGAARVVARDTDLARAARAWARASRATRAMGEDSRVGPARLLAMGAASLVARPVVYVTP